MAASLWHRLGCCLAGHDYAITSDRARMFLRCKNCGRTSHGLEIAEDPFRKRSQTQRAATRGTRAAASRSDFATQ
jgi:hypothetical protein